MADIQRPEPPVAAKTANASRLVAVWLALVAAMGLVGLACWVALALAGPQPTATEPAGKEPAADTFLDRVISPDGSAPVRPWDYIVIHHSATRSATLEAISRWHRENLHIRDAGYHFIINNGRAKGTADGEILPTPRWTEQRSGAHCHVPGHPEFNVRGIGICLVGNFEREQPTAAQMASLEALVTALAERYGISLERIVGHGEVKVTECPGKEFPMRTFLWEVRQRMLVRHLSASPGNVAATAAER